MENVRHYNVEKLSAELQAAVANNKLTGPCFIGQGCSEGNGADAWGSYIVEIRTSKTGKPIIGLVRADMVMHSSWVDETMDCSMPKDKTPTQWITVSGKYKSGAPKWWWCDKDGHKFNGMKCRLSFNGAYGHRANWL